ncbi:MAG: hypothetical protein ACE5GW_08350 [Planctomycetota bacterium]
MSMTGIPYAYRAEDWKGTHLAVAPTIRELIAIVREEFHISPSEVDFYALLEGPSRERLLPQITYLNALEEELPTRRRA